MGWTQEKVVATINEMQKQAETDASLRASIKADPKAAIEKIADLQVPAGFTINVADLNDAELTIILPKIKSDELSDGDLEAVAGGKWSDDAWNATIDLSIKDVGNAMVDSVCDMGFAVKEISSRSGSIGN